MGKEVGLNDGKMEEVAKKENVKAILSEEDFDNNPDLAKQGLNVGDEVEIPVLNKSEDEGEKPEFGSIANTPMEEGELMRIVVQQTKDGSLFIHTKQDDDSKNLTMSEVVGMLETAKFDILTQEKQEAASREEEYHKHMAELIPITLEEQDFESFPELRDMAGRKAGQTIELPRFSVQQLLEARKSEEK